MRFESHPCDFCGALSPYDCADGWWNFDRYTGPGHWRLSRQYEISGRGYPTCSYKIHNPQTFVDMVKVQRVTRKLTS